jgi:hypothetical protein
MSTTTLSSLIRLEELCLRFQSPRSRPASDLASRRPPPPARSVLNALRLMEVGKYLDDLLARIDALDSASCI